MTLYDFDLVLDQRDVDEAGADRLYAQCKDATLITEGDLTWLDFGREGHTLHAAIRSAVADVEAAGFRVARVEMGAEAVAALREAAVEPQVAEVAVG